MAYLYSHEEKNDGLKKVAQSQIDHQIKNLKNTIYKSDLEKNQLDMLIKYYSDLKI